MTENTFSFYCAAVANNFNLLKKLEPMIMEIVTVCEKSLQAGGKIIFIGNGGSAADSQHLAAELVGRYKKNRAGIAAIALTTDTSALTAIANDFGYDHVFSRQLEALGKKGDVLFALSTSGNSSNIIQAITTAKNIGITVVGLTGGSGGKMKNDCDYLLAVPSSETNHIQEMHIAIGHFICGALEEKLST